MSRRTTPRQPGRGGSPLVGCAQVRLGTVTRTSRGGAAILLGTPAVQHVAAGVQEQPSASAPRTLLGPAKPRGGQQLGRLLGKPARKRVKSFLRPGPPIAGLRPHQAPAGQGAAYLALDQFQVGCRRFAASCQGGENTAPSPPLGWVLVEMPPARAAAP